MPGCCVTPAPLRYFFSASGFAGSYVTHNGVSLGTYCNCSPSTLFDAANASFSFEAPGSGACVSVIQITSGCTCTDGTKGSGSWHIDLLQSADKLTVKWRATYVAFLVPIICEQGFQVCWDMGYQFESASFAAPMDCFQTISNWTFIGEYPPPFYDNGNVLDCSGAQLLLHT